MSKHNFQETLDNESDLRKTLGYNKVYNDLKNNFLVLKMPLKVQPYVLVVRGGNR